MRETRLYSLFARVDGCWLRLSPFAMAKASAVVHYQTALFGGSLSGREMALRVVQGEAWDEKDAIDRNRDKVFGG